VAALKQQNLIDKKMVSFFLSLDKMSQFTFGGYSSDLVKKGENIRWYKLQGTRLTYWQVEI
jgi:hypothetical protein